MELKRVDKVFIGVIIAEMIITFVASFYMIDWPNSCTPSVFMPLGGGGAFCAQVVTPALHPLFFLAMDLLMVTLTVYVVFLVFDSTGIAKKKKRKRK